MSPSSDTGMFATYGTLLLRGARPYVDFWDLHPPLVFAYWALVDAIAGSDWLQACAPPTTLLPQQSCTALVAHGQDLLLSVAAAMASAAIIRQGGGSRFGAAVAAVLVVGFSDQAMLSQEGSNPSKLTLLPSTVAVLAYLASLRPSGRIRFALISGVAAGVAVLAKQPAGLTLVALAAHAAWRRDWLSVGALACGAGAVVAVACAVLAVFGSLEGFVAEAWVYNLQRVLAGYFVQPAKPPTVGLARVLTESAGLLAAPGVLGGVIVASTPRNAHHRVLVWWACANIVAITAFREFVYVVPSVAIVGALGVERVWQRRFVHLRWPVRTALLSAAAVGLLLTTGFQRAELARSRFERTPAGTLTRTEQLGQALRGLPAGPLFVYGNGAEMYVLANRAPANRYLNAEALRATAPGGGQARAELATALGSHPPPMVTLAPHSDEPELQLAGYPALGMFLDACYSRDARMSTIDQSWNVLVRKGECGES